MEFGSEQTLALIRERLPDADGGELYTLLDGIVRRDCTQLLQRVDIAPQDREDLLQDVCLNVFRHLVPFALSAAGQTVGQRNSWLKTILVNRVNDFFRARKRTVILSLDSLEEGGAAIPSGEPPMGDPGDQEAALQDAVEQLLRLRTSTDKLLAFMLGVLTVQGANMKAAEISDALNGRTFLEGFEIVSASMRDALGYDMPPEIRQQFLNRIEPDKDRIFSISARIISDSANWIRKKMRSGR